MSFASFSILRHTPPFTATLLLLRRISIVTSASRPQNPKQYQNPNNKNILKAKQSLKKDFSSSHSLTPTLSLEHKPSLSPSQAIGTVAAAQANFMRVIISDSNSNDDAVQEPCNKNGVVSEHCSNSGLELLCVVRAVLKKIKRRVMVGDKVVVGSIDWVDRRGMIENVFQRKTEILDPPVANVDHLLVLFSLDQPKLEPFSLTRFLVEAESNGIPITLALNKMEIVPKETISSWKARLRSWGYEPIIAFSLSFVSVVSGVRNPMWGVIRSRTCSLSSTNSKSSIFQQWRRTFTTDGVSQKSILELQEIEKILTDVKADDVKVIPVPQHCDWADFMVVATGRSTWHVKNIAQALIYQAKQKQKGADRMLLPSVEGQAGGKWIIVDSGKVIVHALDEKARAYYNLEGLWTPETLQKDLIDEDLQKSLVKVRRINNSKKKPAQKNA